MLPQWPYFLSYAAFSIGYLVSPLRLLIRRSWCFSRRAHAEKRTNSLFHLESLIEFHGKVMDVISGEQFSEFVLDRYTVVGVAFLTTNFRRPSFKQRI